ncbi:hypothetical protein C9374_003946 [Naegleria lovaniensis]|uniref:Uncharacterized protein n=1 Tax=Naegleria lovaniensis TaxID=51637 RepID=A0AA88H8X9_NAELO|nr:uncharacterized protein C9374_003946 [Naegleria lovaniensis]KAG2394182.1 hypothetical protein C9374_003946 [Naegleria lovaniensis]
MLDYSSTDFMSTFEPEETNTQTLDSDLSLGSSSLDSFFADESNPPIDHPSTPNFVANDQIFRNEDDYFNDDLNRPLLSPDFKSTSPTIISTDENNPKIHHASLGQSTIATSSTNQEAAVADASQLLFDPLNSLDDGVQDLVVVDEGSVATVVVDPAPPSTSETTTTDSGAATCSQEELMWWWWLYLSEQGLGAAAATTTTATHGNTESPSCVSFVQPKIPSPMYDCPNHIVNTNTENDEANNKKKRKRRGGNDPTTSRTTSSQPSLASTSEEEEASSLESKTKKRKTAKKKKAKGNSSAAASSSSSSRRSSDEESTTSDHCTNSQTSQWYNKLSASATYLELELVNGSTLAKNSIDLHIYSSPRRQYGPIEGDLDDLKYHQTLRIHVGPLSEYRILSNHIYISLKEVLKQIRKPRKTHTWIRIENSPQFLFLYCQTGKAPGVHNVVNISSSGTITSRTGSLNKYSPCAKKPNDYEFIILDHCSKTSH